MNEVVIVPTYQRSAMLYTCLEAIRAADPLISLHVFPDRGENESVIADKFGAAHHYTVSHTYHGNSYNVMEALKWAYDRHYDIAYIIEDDAIIDPTFFDWCRQALTLHGDAFAACGWQYSPDALPPSDGPDMMMSWYLSVCAAIPKRSLFALQQHAKPEYYANMKAYLAGAYPNSIRIGSNHYEQDGLALRVADSQSRQCVWPRRPRATHIGWYGYHMENGSTLAGSLEDQVALIKMTLADPVLLKGMMAGGRPPEIKKCVCGKPLLSTNANARIMCADCFHLSHPSLPRTASSHYYFRNNAKSA